MASKVYETQTVKLFSEKEIQIRPLKISVLREFMKTFEKFQNVEGNDETMGVLVECVAVAMRQYEPELSDKHDGGLEALEDELDMPTVYKIIEVAANIKLGDDEDPQ